MPSFQQNLLQESTQQVMTQSDIHIISNGTYSNSSF